MGFLTEKEGTGAMQIIVKGKNLEVTEALRQMVGMEVGEINVYVDDVQ